MDILLPTKLYTPAARERLVPRTHLIALLNEGLSRKATLIAAPAGFGKTMLAATWLNQLPEVYRSAWYSIEKGDNDPARFVAYCIAALQQISAEVGKTVTAALPPAVALRTVIPDLITIAQPFVLVLDDYHLISTPEIHAGIEDLLAYMPPHMHLVLLSRSDPPFSLSKLRVRDQLTELRARDLRFGAEETAEFLNATQNLSLSREEITVLERRTEGWIGGLQLAALSLQQADDKQAFLNAFAGDDHFIADYLLEEVLATQTEPVQEFLLQTAILNNLNEDLCNAVLERNDSGAMLALLEQSNLFIVSLDTRRQWYRYFQLFADLLRDRMSEEATDVQGLHRRASRWYADNGQLYEAVEHALDAREFSQALNLILSGAAEIFMNSRLLTLIQWWHRLPDQLRSSNLSFNMMMAWAWLATGNRQAMERGLQEIERMLGKPSRALLSEIEIMEPSLRNSLIEVATVRISHDSAVREDAAETLALCECIFPYLDPGNTLHLFTPLFVLRPVILFNMGIAHRLLGALSQAAALLKQANEEAQALGNIHVVASSFARLAIVQTAQGFLREAAVTCRRGLDVLESLAASITPMSGLLYVQLGAVHYEWNEIDKAAEYVRHGIALADPWHNREALLPGTLILARIAAAQGRQADVQEALARFDQLLGLTPDPSSLAQRADVDAWLGRLQAAQRWLDHVDAGAIKDSPENPVVVRCHILLRQGLHQQALTMLETYTSASDTEGAQVLAMLLLANARDMAGDRMGALHALTRAVSDAETEGYVRTFIDCGMRTEALLFAGTNEELMSSYARELLNACAQTQTQGAAPPSLVARAERTYSATSDQVADVVEPLTPREQEVLTLIGQGLTNKEIAARLVLSVGTVKVHAHNIYVKLDVTNRTQAISRARTLALIA